MNRAIQYNEFGGPDVLNIVETATVEPGAGEVRVSVKAAGLNPVDWKIFSAAFGGDASNLPLGVGNDFAGVIDAVGAGVTGLAVGDEVLGSLTSKRSAGADTSALAEQLIAAAKDVEKKPAGVSFVDAASLGIATLASSGGLRELAVQGSDVIVISAAAGGVGSIAVQLAVHAGATVIGIASQSNADYLASLGAIPVAYGPDLEERVRAAAPSPVTKLLDCYGPEYVDLALTLGLDEGAYGTLVPTPEASEKGAVMTGSRHAEAGDLAQVARYVADGTFTVSIAGVYPFTTESVRKAYDDLMTGHVRGKLVVEIA